MKLSDVDDISVSIVLGILQKPDTRTRDILRRISHLFATMNSKERDITAIVITVPGPWSELEFHDTVAALKPRSVETVNRSIASSIYRSYTRG